MAAAGGFGFVELAVPSVAGVDIMVVLAAVKRSEGNKGLFCVDGDRLV
jgi:hypothetical protein